MFTIAVPVASLRFFVQRRYLSTSRPEAEFLDEIQTKVLRVFLLAIQSPLFCSFALRFLFLQTHEIAYSFYSSVTVHCKGKRRKTMPPSLWFKKSIQKPQVREPSRLCPETSTKFHVH
jgi:hypothetical protein